MYKLKFYISCHFEKLKEKENQFQSRFCFIFISSLMHLSHRIPHIHTKKIYRKTAKIIIKMTIVIQIYVCVEEEEEEKKNKKYIFNKRPLRTHKLDYYVEMCIIIFLWISLIFYPISP